MKVPETKNKWETLKDGMPRAESHQKRDYRDRDIQDALSRDPGSGEHPGVLLMSAFTHNLVLK